MGDVDESLKRLIEQIDRSLDGYLSGIRMMTQTPLIISELVHQLEKTKEIEKECLCKNRMVKQCFINASWAFQELME